MGPQKSDTIKREKWERVTEFLQVISLNRDFHFNLRCPLFDHFTEFTIDTMQQSESRKLLRISLLTCLCLTFPVIPPITNGSGYCSSPIIVYETSLAHKNMSGLSDCKYPQFKGMHNQSKLNAMVKEKVEKEINSFLNEHSNGDYAVSCDVTSIVEKFVSFVVKFRNTDTNAIEKYSCINLRTSDLKPITVESLLGKPLNSREVFLILVLEAFSKKSKDFNSGLLVEELFAEPSYLQNFSISPKSITFYFNRGALAADALGSQQIVIPLDRVGPLIGNSSLLSQGYRSEPRGNLDRLNAIRTERDLCNLAVKTYTRLLKKGEEHPELYYQRARWYRKLGLNNLAKKDQALEEKCSEPTEIEKKYTKPQHNANTKLVAPRTTSCERRK